MLPVAFGLALVLAQPALSQQTCQEIEAVILACPESDAIFGDPPSCHCAGLPIEPLELTCPVNFGCPMPAQVASGHWPSCTCPAPDEIVVDPGSGGDGGGTGTGVGAGLGGSDVGEQFLECPSGAEMEVLGGQCTCTLIMWPEFEE